MYDDMMHCDPSSGQESHKDRRQWEGSLWCNSMSGCSRYSSHHIAFGSLSAKIHTDDEVRFRKFIY
jgi:hypothetical protein